MAADERIDSPFLMSAEEGNMTNTKRDVHCDYSDDPHEEEQVFALHFSFPSSHYASGSGTETRSGGANNDIF